MKIKRITEKRPNRVYCENISFQDLYEELHLLMLDKDTTKFRIYEGSLRVRDFSYCNLNLELTPEHIKFKFRFKGDPGNWIHFSDNSDVIYNYRRKFIEIRVYGEVYYEDGTRRYDQVFEDELDEEEQ
jgi:hypothetical protein